MTESVFSMDGDLAPLAAICDAAGRQEAMVLVDEAHAIGVFGAIGAGLVREGGLGDRVNACTATLSKALGSYGGFIVCSRELRWLLENRCRQFLYSTALSAGERRSGNRVARDHPDHPRPGADAAGGASLLAPGSSRQRGWT